MGDEGHNRNLASTSLLARRLAPFIAAQADAKAIETTLNFLAGNDHFALNISMAGAKLAMDAAVGVENSTLVTTMARNGVEFGLRVAATGARVVHDAGRAGRRPLLPRLRARGRQSRPRRLGHHRDPRARRVRHGGIARHHAVRRRNARRRAGGHPLDAPDHARTASGVPAAAHELRRHAVRHRCARRHRDRRTAHDQHGHRAQGTRDRPDRRRHRAGAVRGVRRCRAPTGRTPGHRPRPPHERRADRHRGQRPGAGRRARIDRTPARASRVVRRHGRRTRHRRLDRRRDPRQRPAGRVHPASRRARRPRRERRGPPEPAALARRRRLAGWHRPHARGRARYGARPRRPQLARRGGAHPRRGRARRSRVPEPHQADRRADQRRGRPAACRRGGLGGHRGRAGRLPPRGAEPDARGRSSSPSRSAPSSPAGRW